MATTKITANVLAPDAAQNNINSGAAFNVTVPTTISNSLVANNLVYKGGNTEGATLTIGTNDAQQLTLETNGSSRMIITSAGAVGFGVTSIQSGFTFEVAGQSKFGNQLYLGSNLRMFGTTPLIAGDDLRFANGNSVEMMRLSTNGNVGIGTTTPATKLHVSGSGQTGRIRIQSTDDNPVLEMQSSSGTSYLFTNAGDWMIRTDSPDRHVKLQAGATAVQGKVQIGSGSITTNAGPTPASQLVVRDNTNSTSSNILDLQDFAGNSKLQVRSDGQVTIVGGITADNLVYKGGNIEGAALTIGTNDSQDLNFETNGSTRMSITSAGGVVVNTSASNPKFTILSDLNVGDNDNSAFLIRGVGINKPAAINLRTTGSAGEEYKGWLCGRVGGGIHINNSLVVSIGNSGPQTGAVTLMANSAGNVGINTSTPTSKLHLKSGGTTTATSTLKIDTTTDTQTLLVRDDGRVFIGNGTATNSVSILNVQGESFFTSNIVTNGGIFASTFSAPAGSSLRLSTYNQPYVYITNNALGDPLNFGIGTTTPNEKLTVVGNISASGNVTANNLVYTSGDQTIAGVKTFSDNVIGNGTSNRLPNQTASTSDSIITKSLLEELTTPSVNNTNVISHFDDFLGPHVFTRRLIHGGAGTLTLGQVGIGSYPFDTVGILGMRAGASTSPSSADGITYPNHSNQGNQTFLNTSYIDRKYFSRFSLYGSLTRAYYHFLVGTCAPNSTANQFYTGNPSSRSHLGVIGCTAGTPIRQNNTSYIVGDIVTLTDSIYRWRCVTAGTTAASEPTFNKVINSTTTDNTVVWSLETYNTNGFWAVLNMNNTLPFVDGNQAELIITDIPIETLVAYKVVYDFYTESSVKKVRVYMQSGSGSLNLIANLNASTATFQESPYYAVQREQPGTNVIGSSPSVVPWLEIDYFGFTATVSR